MRWLMARGRRASGVAAAPRSRAAGAPARRGRRVRVPSAFKRPAKTLWWVGGGAHTNSELPQAGFPESGEVYHHHHHQRSSRGRFEWSARFHRPSRRVAGPGKRHSARGTPRAQPRDVRSAGRDTWNLTGEALGGPRKRSWRRCSRARSGRLSAIRGAHSGAFDRP